MERLPGHGVEDASRQVGGLLRLPPMPTAMPMADGVGVGAVWLRV